MTYVEEASRLVKALPPDKAKAVVEYARYLAWKSSDEYTRVAGQLDTDKLLRLIGELKPEREAAEKDPDF